VDAPDGPSVSYTYDAADRLLSTTYGAAVTTLIYDLAGRKTQMIDPDMGTWSYRYNALGELVRQTDARGQRICLYYDGLGRLAGKHYRTDDNCPATPTLNVSYTYDQGPNGVGQRTRMDDSSGFTTWSYDTRGRVTEVYQSVTGSGAFRTQWGYNAADLPVWMRYPLDNGGNLGETVNYTYNTQMLLDRVYGTDTYVDDTWYDAAGRVTLRELGSNYTLGQSYLYYPWTQQGGRLQNLQSGIALDTDSLQSLSYGYDAGGNVLSIIDYKAGGTQTQTFTYDALDRLRTAVASGGTGGTYSLQNYDYDTQGRLELNATVTNFYENTAHLHAVSRTSSGNLYGYDANGNQTSRRVSGTTYTLIYDAESRLVQVKLGKTIQATYTYDGDGNRVKTVVGSTTTTYIGNYLEWTGSTTTMKKYYYSGGQRVAMRQGSTLYFLLTDHLGSTAITATSGGGFSAELRYYPWGGTRYTSGTTPTSYRYTGQREAEVGLYYYGARFYDAYLSQWIQPDSIIPDPYTSADWNRYSYVRYNPLKYVDPSGHFCYDSESNEFSDGDCFDEMQQELLDYFIEQLESGDYTDLELAGNLINKALELNSDPVIALRAASEIVRESTPNHFGWSYEAGSKFYYRDHTDVQFDDSGFGDLADTETANQIAHTIGIAYIAAYQERAGQGFLTRALVWGNEIGKNQSAKQTYVDRDLGYIAADLGRDLIANESEAVSNAISAIGSYNYADAHQIRNWWDSIRWPWSK
jgi:RHS repeat-associated protein